MRHPCPSPRVLNRATGECARSSPGRDRRRPLRRALLLACLLLQGGGTASAGGATSHLAQASFALEHVQEQQLSDILGEHQDMYLNGANFPDTFNLFSNIGAQGIWLTYYNSGETHSAKFLSAYAQYLVAHPGVGADRRMAHFMGVLAHIVGDQRFDRYFMTRVARECFPETFHDPIDHYWTAQLYTDLDLDWVLSDLRFEPLYPDSGIHSPSVSKVPWAVGHWSPLFVEPSVLEYAYPLKTPIQATVLAAGVLAGRFYIDNEQKLIDGSFKDFGPAKTFFDYGEDTWLDGIGGAHDGGEVIAGCMNRVYEILQQGGLPAFEEYGDWPHNELRVYDAWAAQPVRADFGSWVAGPEGVERVELEGDRIVALRHGPSGSSLTQLDGFLEEPWEPLLDSGVPIADLQLDGESTAVLLEDQRLLVQPGGDAAWYAQLDDVSAFQLEGEHSGAVVQGDLLLQSGGPLEPWDVVGLPPVALPGAQHVQDFQLELQSQGESGPGLLRVAALTRQRAQQPEQVVSRLWLGQGLGAHLEWQLLWQGTHDAYQGSGVEYRMDGARMAFLADGSLHTSEDPLVAPWVEQLTGVAQFQLAGDCLAVLDTQGSLLRQTGSFDEPWVLVHGDVSAFDLEGYNPAWPSADPWLAYTLADQSLHTNRTLESWGQESLPHSHHLAMPGTAAASAFRIEATQPYEQPGDGAPVTIKIEDRLAIVSGGRVFVTELARSETEPSGTGFTLSKPDGSPKVQLTWDGSDAGPDDFVALFDEDPLIAGPDGYLALQWAWATNAPTWVSTKNWKPGYYMGYVREDAFGNREVTQTTPPTPVAAVQSLDVLQGSVANGTKVGLSWKADDVGHRDYVALFDQDPLVAGPDGHLTLQWQWARKDSPWISGKAHKAGYYVAYVSEDVHGVRTILDVAGPTTTSGEAVWLKKSTFWFWTYVRLEWTATDIGAKDYVALYDKDPHLAGPNGYLAGQWDWASSGSGWTTWKAWSPGYHVAYIQEDAQGVRTIKATWGPSK